MSVHPPCSAKSCVVHLSVSGQDSVHQGLFQYFVDAMTAFVYSRAILTSGCPHSEVQLQLGCSDCLSFALSLFEECPAIVCSETQDSTAKVHLLWPQLKTSLRVEKRLSLQLMGLLRWQELTETRHKLNEAEKQLRDSTSHAAQQEQQHSQAVARLTRDLQEEQQARYAFFNDKVSKCLSAG